MEMVMTADSWRGDSRDSNHNSFKNQLHFKMCAAHISTHFPNSKVAAVENVGMCGREVILGGIKAALVDSLSYCLGIETSAEYTTR